LLPNGRRNAESEGTMSEVEQGSEAWFQQRCGKATASRISDIVAKTKTGYSTSRANYMAQLVVERMTNQVAESYSNAAMEWGVEHEPFARGAYEAKTGNLVDQVGAIDHPSIPMSAASPDGLVGDEGCLEIKCPNTATHIETILGEEPAKKYYDQMQWQMACTGRKWCDFVSYDPRMPEHLKLLVKRVERNDVYIAELEREVSQFLAEVDDKVKKLNEIKV
jgi:putative phage-type endonuclease